MNKVIPSDAIGLINTIVNHTKKKKCSSSSSSFGLDL
jgi:hypothetical protein